MNLGTATRALLILSAYILLTKGERVPKIDKLAKYWKNIGKNEMRHNLRVRSPRNENIAKNIIMFVGSGMDVETVTAARILSGQLQGEPGEQTKLQMEMFEDFGLLKTYNLNKQIAGRASAASALLCGVKNKDRTLGVNGKVDFEDCTASESNQVSSILSTSLAAGKAVGIVTTGRITEGAAAAAYAYSASDEWEGDSMVPSDVSCMDIAKQAVKSPNDQIKVLFGGGRKFFLDSATTDPETGSIDSNQRQDGTNIVSVWKTLHTTDAEYVTNFEEYVAMPGTTQYALGLFDSDRMDYELDRTESGASGEPSLSNMTSKAIDILSEDTDGFFLLVESGRIGEAHKEGFAKKALYDTIELDTAIKLAISNTNVLLNETLIVVAGDVSQAMYFDGMSNRGRDILSLTNFDESNSNDTKPKGVLSYANGPGYNTPRTNLTDVDRTGDNYVVPSGVPLVTGTDTAADVPMFASGPMSYLFNGLVEQSYIANAMAYTFCLGEYENACPRRF